MPDYNSEASKVWDALRPAIDSEIDQRTRGMVQRRKAKVTTAPSLVTNKIGVTEPYGTEIFIPFVSNLASAVVGDYVWVEFMYGANNSFASMFASADSKDQTVAGNLTVGGVLDVTQRRCYATIPANSIGWYRIIQYDAADNYEAIGDYGRIFNISLVRRYNDGNNEVHKITLMNPYNVFKFTDETSVSNGFFFTKIRATYNSTTHKTYIDVYYDSTRSNNVAAFFDVYSAEPDAQARAVSVPFTNVSAAPSGETVMTEYTFSANGTGDLTVNGVLDVTPRRCYAALSSAGWYRVLRIDAGRAAWSFSVDFDITRVFSSADNEVHSVKLLETYNAIPLFANEVSKTNALYVGAIRYTLNSNGVGYVDIRYDGNTSNTVVVDFTVHTAPERQPYFTAESLQSVAISPSGETVLTEYSFAANTNGTVTSSFSTSKGSVYAYRSGDMVTVSFLGDSTTWTEDEVFMTIADGIRPAMSIDAVAYIGRQAVVVRINQNGNIVLWIGSTLTGNQRLYFSATYPIQH